MIVLMSSGKYFLNYFALLIVNYCICRKTAVVGITPLDYDHISLLGNTLESIAWNKGGIMKKGCIAFTVDQPESVLKVFADRSIEKDVNSEIY